LWLGRLSEVSEEPAGLGLVGDDGEKAKTAVTLRTVEDVDVVASPEEGGPVCARPGHQEQAVEQAAQVRVAQHERRA
jgi:hypothetical protein